MQAFDNITNRYSNSLTISDQNKMDRIDRLGYYHHQYCFAGKKTPTGFIPTEDQSIFLYSLNMPAGASLERTKKVVAKVDSIIATVEAVEKSYSVAG